MSDAKTLFKCAIADIEGLLLQAFPDGSADHPARETLAALQTACDNEIFVSWHIADVHSVAEDQNLGTFTDEQCMQVLVQIHKDHDSETGINRDVITDELLGLKRELS